MIQQQSAEVKLRVEKGGTIKVTFRLPEKMVKRLKHKAIDENIPINTLAIEAFTDFLEKESKRFEPRS
jgi:predicted HicB family RNase H-like nuclease